MRLEVIPLLAPGPVRLLRVQTLCQQGEIAQGVLRGFALSARQQWVIIGGEGRWNELSECSLVVSPYGVSGEATGALGVMGPMRMPYSRAISTVRYVAGLLSDLFRDLYGGVEELTSSEEWKRDTGAGSETGS